MLNRDVESATLSENANEITECIEYRRLNVVIEKSIYKKIKEHCVKNDISISEITRKMWLDYLDNNSMSL